MLQNIDKVLERGEKIDTILVKSDTLMARFLVSVLFSVAYRNVPPLTTLFAL